MRKRILSMLLVLMMVLSMLPVTAMAGAPAAANHTHGESDRGGKPGRPGVVNPEKPKCHQMIEVEAKAPTCTEDGNIKYYLENGTLMVPKRAQEEILLAVL